MSRNRLCEDDTSSLAAEGESNSCRSSNSGDSGDSHNNSSSDDHDADDEIEFDDCSDHSESRLVLGAAELEEEKEEEAMSRLNQVLNQKRSFEYRAKTCCTISKLKKRFPPLLWLPHYSTEDLRGDLIAGLSVSFTLIPQALAMALLAQLPMQNGLYSSFVGPFVYIFLGSCKDITIGPTSIMAIITAKYTGLGGVNYALLLSFFAGLIQLICGLLNMGFLVEFIPFPVISAFSTAAAITIFIAQLRPFLGIQTKSVSLFDVVKSPAQYVRLWDSLLGLFCFSTLVGLKLWSVRLSKQENSENIPIIARNGSNSSPRWTDFRRKGLKLFIMSRNALLVFLCAVLGYCVGSQVFILTQDIKPGLPDFRLPSLIGTANETVWQELVTTISDLNAGILIVAFLSFLETIAIAKSIENSSKLSGLKKSFDATQEMLALGASNVLGACFGAFPVTGSFTRSAINHFSGVRTPMSNLISGLMVLLSLSPLIAPYFHFIPQTTLASVIMSSVVFMMKPGDLVHIFDTNRMDLVPYLATFVACTFYSLEIGILIGVGVAIVMLLYRITRPQLDLTVDLLPTNSLGRYLTITPRANVFYPSVEYLKMKITKTLKLLQSEIMSSDGVNGGQIKLAVVLDCTYMWDIDSTFVLSFRQFMRALDQTEIMVVLYRPTASILKNFDGFRTCDDKETLFRVIGQYYHRTGDLC